MCGKDYKACGTKEYLRLADIQKIYDHLDMDAIVDVIYGGGGEPFLNPDLGKIAAHTRAVQPAVQHTVISNLIQWKNEEIVSLLDSNVNFLVSVNGASKETYQRVTGVDAFDTVTEHIRRLAAMNKRHRCPVNISISIILMRQNIEELPDFIRLAASLGVGDVKSLYVRVYPEEYRDKSSGSTPISPQDSLFFHQDIGKDMIVAAEKIAAELNIQFEHEPLIARRPQCTRDCKEPWKSLFINFNGDVYPCPASEILFKSKVDSRMYKSGNILEQDYREFWNNEFWQALRETNIQRGRSEIIPECQCCGNAINWCGPGSESAHIMDWRKAKKSTISK